MAEELVRAYDLHVMHCWTVEVTVAFQTSPAKHSSRVSEHCSECAAEMALKSTLAVATLSTRAARTVIRLQTCLGSDETWS